MLYDQSNMGLFAMEQPLQHSLSPWYYSSGTTNILSALMAQKFASHQEYLDFPHEKLFAPLGISNFTLETDAEGYYRSEEHTSELQSRGHLVCRLLLEKKNTDYC